MQAEQAALNDRARRSAESIPTQTPRPHPSESHKEAHMYPYTEGDFIVIGPECFAAKDGSVLSWRGENYVPQKPTLRVRFHNWRVRRANRSGSDALA